MYVCTYVIAYKVCAFIRDHHIMLFSSLSYYAAVLKGLNKIMLMNMICG